MANRWVDGWDISDTCARRWSIGIAQCQQKKARDRADLRGRHARAGPTTSATISWGPRGGTEVDRRHVAHFLVHPRVLRFDGDQSGILLIRQSRRTATVRCCVSSR